jgi:uncharacterized C2H2 Zn-finger protein
MSATLTRSDVHPTPPNQIMVRCPRCDTTFRLNYSDDEWHRLKGLLAAAERALREDHKQRHEVESLALNREPLRLILGISPIGAAYGRLRD